MDNKTIAGIGVIGLLSVLLTGSILFTPEQLDNAYICLATNEVGIFYGGVSGTGLTAYPYTENRSDYVRCYSSIGEKSVWIKLTDYAKEENISLNELLNNKEDPITEIDLSYNDIKYSCTFSNKYINETIVSKQECKKIG